MNILSKIGLAVTGCKNGYSIFGSAGTIATPDGEATRALRDMRSYLRISEPRHEFFSMEYLDNFIVYSIYRSSIDSVGSTGAYIAVHLFLPYNMVAKDMVDILTSLLNMYWDEFMHPMFGSPLPGKIEDISRLTDALEGMASRFHEVNARYAHTNSIHSQLPLYIAYRSLQEVDAIMANPLHSAYYRGSRLILAPASFIDNPQANAATFNTAVQTILPQHGRPEGLIGALTLPPNMNLRLVALTVNGVDVLSSGEDFSLDPDSFIEFTLKAPGRQVCRFAGTVEQALHQKCIRKTGCNYEIAPTLVTVKATIANPGLMRPDLLPVLISASGRETRIQNLPGGNAGWLVPSDGFPYSLGLFTPDQTHLIQDNFVTVATFSSTPYHIDMAKLSEMAGTNRPPELPEPENEDLVETGTNRMMYIIIAAIALLAIGAGIWWFFLRDKQEEQEKQEELVTAVPDSTVLIIDEALLPSSDINWSGIAPDSITQNAGMLPYKPGSPLSIVLHNKLWKEGNRQLRDTINIYFLDRTGKRVETLSITESMIDSISNLRLYPKNTISHFRVHKPIDNKSEEVPPATSPRVSSGNSNSGTKHSPGTIEEGSIMEAVPGLSEETTEKQNKVTEDFKRAEVTQEVKEMINQLHSDPSAENIKKAQLLLNHLQKDMHSQLPILNEAIKKAKANARARKTVANDKSGKKK